MYGAYLYAHWLVRCTLCTSMHAYLYTLVKACLYCMYLYAFSSFQETKPRWNRILFPPFFPWKQKPVSVSIFPVPPGHWLALSLEQHALTIRDSRRLTGAHTCTPCHHTWSTAETGSCLPHFFLGNRNPFPFPFFQYLQATSWHRCWCSTLQLSEIAGTWQKVRVLVHHVTILGAARKQDPISPIFSSETETHFHFHFSSTSRLLVGIVAGAARFDYQR